MLVVLFSLCYALTASRPIHFNPEITDITILTTRDTQGLNSTTFWNEMTAECTCPKDQRSVFDIIWSCLAVIFTCTFVTIHPNVPHPEASSWQIMRRRAHLMCWALIAPELLVLWAMRQWYGARALGKLIKVPGWTNTHGYFVQMGGFMLWANDRCLGVVDPRNLLMFFDKGYMYFNDERIMKDEIMFSLPREEDIKDKGKGDGLSKALVVGQTLWFIAQCLSRWQQGLVVTELELVTLAFAALNGAIYFLWWDKPLDVGCAVPIIWKRPESSATPDNMSEKDLLKNMVTVIQRAVPVHEDPSLLKRTSRFFFLCLNKLGAPFRLSTWARIPARVLELRKDYVYKPMSYTEMEVSPLSAYLPSYDHMDSSFSIMIVTSTIATMFGAIHLIAFRFQFPTVAERWVWRGGAFLITIIPIILLGRSVVRYRSFTNMKRANGRFTSRKTRTLISFWVMVVLCPIYAVARVVLLVEAFVALRQLEPRATASIDWTKFFPHIG
ncbi:hypothetical protein D9619_002812 [Psilocybe cf. subviscida]|uniref:Uncharacterized protein n=1 Tax=Psilocybe cf. subviscida TaxID=2480587 RepID=A0A8H5AYE0_9AGAR|nr:hypothetical protein D9619_002812 [Psilocybe cf. subviscida]